MRRKLVKRRLVKYGLIVGNVVALVAVVGFVAHSATEKQPETVIVASANANAAVATTPADPVDRLTAYDVAANIAQATKLTEMVPITNQAQSAKVAVAMSTSDTGISAKPQVVDTALKSWRDVRDYVVVEGDTASAIGQKFGVTADSIRWSNNLPSEAVTVGSTLLIPPVNGIAITIKAGDTPQTLAVKYHANASQIAQYNDAEKGGLVVGRKAIIPEGKVITARAATTTSRSSATIVSGSSGFVASYGVGYDWGWCTYYAAARAGAPGNWGNANTWAYYARLSGWRVSSTPTAGAIFQTPSGWAGHVGIVEEIYPNGTMRVSDMNGFSGFGRVGYAVVSVGAYPNYITRN